MVLELRIFSIEYYREPGATETEFKATLLPDTVLPIGLKLTDSSVRSRSLTIVSSDSQRRAIASNSGKSRDFCTTSANRAATNSPNEDCFRISWSCDSTDAATGEKPRFCHPYRFHRLVNYIKGLNYLDDRLAPLLTRLEVENDAELPPSQQAVADTIVQCWQQTFSTHHLPVIQLLGNDAGSKQAIATRAAAAINRYLYRLPAGLLPAQAGDLENLLRLWQRESILLPVALYLDAREAENTTQLKSFLSRYRGLPIFETREPLPELACIELICRRW